MKISGHEKFPVLQYTFRCLIVLYIYKIIRLFIKNIIPNYMYMYKMYSTCRSLSIIAQLFCDCLYILVLYHCRYFWYRSALIASESINEVGGFNWRVFLTLLLGWVVVYLCVFKGIKSSGKVMC